MPEQCPAGGCNEAVCLNVAITWREAHLTRGLQGGTVRPAERMKGYKRSLSEHTGLYFLSLAIAQYYVQACTA